jgi:hypothetical protein
LITIYTSKKFTRMRNNGSVLVMASVAVLALMILGLGVLTAAYGARLRATKLRQNTMAELAAEAGYEEAIRWMNQQPDVLSAMTPSGRGGRSRTRNSSAPRRFTNGNYTYTIRFNRFLGTQPVYEIESEGNFGPFKKMIRTTVVQEVSGWDMGLCGIPSGNGGSRNAYFRDTDIIETPIHINSTSTSKPDDEPRDIFILRRNNPQFTETVSVGESRYTWWGNNKDKYSSIINLFKKGIYFDQPGCNVTDPCSAADNVSVTQKVDRFSSTTSGDFNFAPVADPAVPLIGANWVTKPAVQLEFFVGGGGQVRITNNCTVCCATGAGNDYMLDLASMAPYKQYDIYGYHYADNSLSVNVPITSTYVRQQISGAGGQSSSAAGGQIFVNGNVIIGGAVGTDTAGNMIMANNGLPSQLQGKLTVVATGNIWIVSPILYAGPQQPAEYQDGLLTKLVPATDNTNVLGLFSQFGVVKVVDPQLSLNVPIDGDSNPQQYINAPGAVLTYQPVGFQTAFSSDVRARQLVDPFDPESSMVVQAAITVCGGGWGAENIGNPASGGRVNVNPYGGKDNLIVAGSITESVQGIVYGLDGDQVEHGFRRCYYFDKRLQTGILPGDMWLQSKYVPTPGGWSDFRL